MEALRLVQNDRLPDVQLRLTDAVTGAVIDISTGTTTVTAHIRAAGSTTIKESIALTKPNGGSDGVVRLSWTATALDTAGDFEAELEIDYNGSKQTLFDVIPITIRPQFA